MGASHALGLFALLLVLAGWVAVQQAWRRVFAEAGDDPDALAGRLGCRAACGKEICPRRANAGEEDT